MTKRKAQVVRILHPDDATDEIARKIRFDPKPRDGFAWRALGYYREGWGVADIAERLGAPEDEIRINIAAALRASR